MLAMILGLLKGRKRVVPVPPLSLDEMLPEFVCDEGSKRERAIVGVPKAIEVNAQELLLEPKMEDRERAFQAGRMAAALECQERFLELMAVARKKVRQT